MACPLFFLSKLQVLQYSQAALVRRVSCMKRAANVETLPVARATCRWQDMNVLYGVISPEQLQQWEFSGKNGAKIDVARELC